MDIFSTVGCFEFNEESGTENLINIILNGLHPNNRLYSATIAELKARFRTSPASIDLVYLEEIFFNIDDNLFSSRKEHANFVIGQPSKRDLSNYKCHKCGKMGHLKQDCNQRSPNPTYKSVDKSTPKKDLSHVTCHICKKTGHYANKCPERPSILRNGKKVTYESAHLAKQDEEL